jgi:predicted dehydrogenase
MEIRWGIIGCGDVTEVKSGPGFQRARGSRLVAVMRRRGELAADYARRHGVPRWFDEAEALIHCPEVDAVYIATPPGSHLDYALQVCAAGKPAYVEKPIARSAVEGRRMVEAFAAARLPLFVAYYRRALPRFVKAKEIVEAGTLGRVTGVCYRYAASAPGRREDGSLPWRLKAQESGGGLFMDLGSHTLDILDFILGPLAEVEGSAANVGSAFDVEDTVAMQFRTATGAPAVALWDFAARVREDRIEIWGAGGRLSLSTFGSEPVRLETGAGTEEFDLPNPPHVQEPLIQTFVDDLLGRDTCPSTGVSALRTAAVMDLVLASYYGGREDAFWERPETWPGRRWG